MLFLFVTQPTSSSRVAEDHFTILHIYKCKHGLFKTLFKVKYEYQ